MGQGLVLPGTVLEILAQITSFFQAEHDATIIVDQEKILVSQQLGIGLKGGQYIGVIVFILGSVHRCRLSSLGRNITEIVLKHDKGVIHLASTGKEGNFPDPDLKFLAQGIPGNIPFRCQSLFGLLKETVCSLAYGNLSDTNNRKDGHAQAKYEENDANGTLHDFAPEK
jgi:hypothetical protein